MQFLINWTLIKEQFKQSIDELITKARQNGKVIPLPVPLTDPSLISAIISNVNCKGCRAPCCQSNPKGLLTTLFHQEYEELKAWLGTLPDGVTPEGIRMPCPFLKNHLCSIYEHRPFSCIVYPMGIPSDSDIAEHVFSLDSKCPESARLARKLYLHAWLVRAKMAKLTKAGYEVFRKELDEKERGYANE